MIWSILTWMFMGLVVGALARLLLPGKQPMGLLGTMGVGIVGALLGGLVSWLFSGGPSTPFMAQAWPGWILSTIGAILVLWLLSKRSHGRRV